jgi:hypothetical protein
VKHTYPVFAGPPNVPPTPLFSKQSVANLETLVAFSPYYRADDASMSGKIELFYQQALLSYNDYYLYDEFHTYIQLARKMSSWYEHFKPPGAKAEEADTSDALAKEGAVVTVGARPVNAIVSRHYNMSGS